MMMIESTVIVVTAYRRAVTKNTSQNPLCIDLLHFCCVVCYPSFFLFDVDLLSFCCMLVVGLLVV